MLIPWMQIGKAMIALIILCVVSGFMIWFDTKNTHGSVGGGEYDDKDNED